MAERIALLWKIVYAWAAISLAIFSLLAISNPGASWGLIGFTLSYGVLLGGLLTLAHPMARAVLRRAGRTGPVPFLLIAIAWSCIEEIWCNSFGCKLAISVLWADLIFVCAVFTAWLASWYFILARRFRFTTEQAVVLGSLTGVFFELILPGTVFASPLGALLIAPFVLLIYRALFLLPMSIMEFTGTRETPVKYVAAIGLPMVAAGAVAVVVFVAFTIAGAPLA